MVANDIINTIAEQYGEITAQNFDELLTKELQQLKQEPLINQIEQKINEVILNYERYESITKFISGNSNSIRNKLNLQINLIYKSFFELQNLINAFMGKKVVITYVHVDEEGQREIRLFDNNISDLGVSNAPWGPKITYQFAQHYATLKNSLPDDQNQGLQSTTNEVEKRYSKYKGRILWQINGKWQGYRLYNRGPINEAFVNFYIHNISLGNGAASMESINTFMVTDEYGVIAADNSNGFLIGDANFGNINFAVKGKYGGPQAVKQVINELKKLQATGFNIFSFNQFIDRFTEQEKNKRHSLSKQLSKQSISQIIRHHTDELTEMITSKIP